MEAEVIIGNPMRIALARGLKVPTLEMMYKLCRAMNIKHTMQKSQL